MGDVLKAHAKTAQPITKFRRMSRLYCAATLDLHVERQMLQFRDNAAVVW